MILFSRIGPLSRKINSESNIQLKGEYLTISPISTETVRENGIL